MKAYRELEIRFREIGLISGSLAILSWDGAVNLPIGSVDSRSEISSYLAVLADQKLKDRKIADLLNEAIPHIKDFSPWQQANLLEMKREHKNAVAIDSRLVGEIEKASTICEMHWKKAREIKDFKHVLPYLKPLFKLIKEKAQQKADHFSLSPYDALIDEYDPGRTADVIKTIFSELTNFLVPFIDKTIAKQPNKDSFDFSMPKTEQRRMVKNMSKELGLNFKKARLDLSTHPFCGGTKDDLRITWRLDPNDYTSGLAGVIHETGHALYEQNLPNEWTYQPVGRARSFSIHESQSLFYEMQLMRSREFCNYFAPKQANELYQHLNWVQKSYIRVDADEVTYPLHVILRFKLEQMLFADQLDIADLPYAWNSEFGKLFGFKPDHDSNGCLQDIHWHMGAFGYFPSYTLGALAAAQIMHAFKKENNFSSIVQNGDFKQVQAWLTTKIHSKACLHSSDNLLLEATGSTLSPKFFIEYLKNKYS